MQGKIVIEFDTATHNAQVTAPNLDGIVVSAILSQILAHNLQQIMIANSLSLPINPKVGVGGFGK